jgi:hypothetical protein
MNELFRSIRYLESIAKQRLKQNARADFERAELLSQLIRYGVCTCYCHFSDSTYHSGAPCCGNAKLTLEK